MSCSFLYFDNKLQNSAVESSLTSFHIVFLAPSHALLLACKVMATQSTGKIEIDFPKAEHDVRWTRIGEFIEGHNTLVDACSESEYLPCIVSDVKLVTHDVKQFVVSVPEGYYMRVPIGHHVKIKAAVQGEIYICQLLVLILLPKLTYNKICV